MYLRVKGSTVEERLKGDTTRPLLQGDNVSEKIEPNGVFYPMWNLKTNADGKILIPFMPQFMKESSLNFEFRTSTAKSHISFDIDGKVSSGEAFIGSVNLRKFSKKNKEENS